MQHDSCFFPVLRAIFGLRRADVPKVPDVPKDDPEFLRPSFVARFGLHIAFTCFRIIFRLFRARRLFSSQTILGSQGCLRMAPVASDLPSLPTLAILLVTWHLPLYSVGPPDGVLFPFRDTSVPSKGLPHPLGASHEILCPAPTEAKICGLCNLRSFPFSDHFSTFPGLATFLIPYFPRVHGVHENGSEWLEPSFIAHFGLPMARLAPPSLSSVGLPDGVLCPFQSRQ